MKFIYIKTVIIILLLAFIYFIYKRLTYKVIETFDFDMGQIMDVYPKYNIKIDIVKETLTKGNQTISYTNKFNSAMSRYFSKNKSEVNDLLEEHGIPVCKQLSWDNTKDNSYNIKKIKKEIPYPIVVKPRSGEKGKHVYTDIYNDEVLMKTITLLQDSRKKDIIIEQQEPGEKYRIFILNQTVIYIRKDSSPFVIGDGINTINKLIKKNNDTEPLPVVYIDKALIKRQGYNMDDVVEKNKKIIISNVAGASNGSRLKIVDNSEVNKTNMKMFIDASKLLKLNNCGIDYITKDISIPYNIQGKIIEINSSPGFVRPVSIFDDEKLINRLVDALFKPKLYN